MPPPSPKNPQSWISWCIVAMQFEFILGPNQRTLKKKNRGALKLGPSQRTLKKLFKVSTCTNSSLNFN